MTRLETYQKRRTRLQVKLCEVEMKIKAELEKKQASISQLSFFSDDSQPSNKTQASRKGRGRNADNCRADRVKDLFAPESFVLSTPDWSNTLSTDALALLR